MPRAKSSRLCLSTTRPPLGEAECRGGRGHRFGIATNARTRTGCMWGSLHGEPQYRFCTPLLCVCFCTSAMHRRLSRVEQTKHDSDPENANMRKNAKMRKSRRSTVCVVIGDGSTPRTAALVAFMTKWQVRLCRRPSRGSTPRTRPAVSRPPRRFQLWQRDLHTATLAPQWQAESSLLPVSVARPRATENSEFW